MIIGDGVILGGGGEAATIVVTAPTGSTVTMSHGGKTTTGTEVSGTWMFKAQEYGTYTVTATKDGKTASQTVVVDAATTYELTLAYVITITITGDTTRAFVIYNGTEYKSTFTIPAGSSVSFRTGSINSTKARGNATITINGESVGTIQTTSPHGQLYENFVPVTDVNVACSYTYVSASDFYGRLVVTGGV